MASKEPTKIRGKARVEEGVLGGIVTTVAELLYSLTQASFGATSDVREAFFGSVRGTIEWIGGSQRQTITLAGNVTGRVDTLIQEGADSVEAWLLNNVERGRETGHGAADLVARTAVSFTGTMEPRQAA